MKERESRAYIRDNCFNNNAQIIMDDEVEEVVVTDLSASGLKFIVSDGTRYNINDVALFKLVVNEFAAEIEIKADIKIRRIHHIHEHEHHGHEHSGRNNEHEHSEHAAHEHGHEQEHKRHHGHEHSVHGHSHNLLHERGLDHGHFSGHAKPHQKNEIEYGASFEGLTTEQLIRLDEIILYKKRHSGYFPEE